VSLYKERLGRRVRDAFHLYKIVRRPVRVRLRGSGDREGSLSSPVGGRPRRKGCVRGAIRTGNRPYLDVKPAGAGEWRLEPIKCWNDWS
jgi:hypothetical protein